MELELHRSIQRSDQEKKTDEIRCFSFQQFNDRFQVGYIDCGLFGWMKCSHYTTTYQ